MENRTFPIKPVFGAQHPPLSFKPTKISSTLMSKKKEQERKFNDYTNNTCDAWEIDDRAMTLKILTEADHDESSDSFKPIRSATSSIGDQLDAKGKMENPSGKSSTSSSSDLKSSSSSPLGSLLDIDQQKRNKFQQILDQSSVDLNALRKASWSGIPRQYRSKAWKLLCGYLPAKIERGEETVTRKRDEYWSYVEQYYHTRNEAEHQETFRQIHKDIPRMSPLLAIFRQNVVQEIFGRILFIWAIRHPASGYVQGINDLVTPFFLVFLSDFVDHEVEIEKFDIASLSEKNLRLVEADSFWATSYLLEGIQDNYTFAQPGIQYKLRTLEELIKRIDETLYRHLKNQHVEFLQFAFRWMNNLLMREFPMRCTIRLWDTYLAEPNGFSQFHLYICAALLVRFSKNLLREKDFQGLLMFLQNLPTQSWTSDDISILTAEAYQLNVMFADAPRHLAAT